MDSRYRRADAEKAIEKYASQFGDDLALRVYTSRLLGQDPELVLSGGGNTSVKSRITEIVGDSTDIIYIKGSGWDLATIEPRGFAACRLARLRRACELPGMTDEQMVAELRGQMIDPTGPAPSVEALLHAFLPAKFVDHTHADAVLAIVDQPSSERLVREVFGDRALFVPYVMPGFLLAKKVVELWRMRMLSGSEPTVMILDKHGIFTWGATALESYERMIANVTRAERHLSDTHTRSRRTLAAPNTRACEALAPVVRGALSRLSGQPWVLTWRTSFPVISFCERDDLDVVSQIGCITPDHAIRTKPRPLVLRIEDADDLGSSRIQIETKIASYAAAYREYFRRSTQARGVVRKELDPFPRVFLFQDLGLLAAGRTWKEAEIVADIYEHTASVIDWATSMGRYEPVGELDLFDVEYWSLEQAKLGKPAAAGLLDRKIVLVTGAASGIGFATASAMLAAGAHVVLTDRDVGQLDKAVLTLSATYSDRVWSCLCDVSAPATVARAVRQTCMRFGGLDVVVSNAGAAFSGGLHTDAGDSALKASFEVNLMGHQNVAKAAASVMLAQNSGGVLLFNASKSAFSPGPDFGPYAVPKAALVALMRQYAVDLAPFGIRSNAVNADRIRTDLFGGGVLEARARARGVDVDEYFKGNLLRRETTGEDVAQAFVFLATAQATTGCVVTVDGGNPAAFPR